MEKKEIPSGIMLLGIVDILAGTFALYCTLSLFAHGPIGMGAIMIPFYLIPASLLPIGIALIKKREIALFVHMLIIPLACLVLSLYMVLIDKGLGLQVLTGCLIYSISSIFYLTRPKVREMFR